MAYTNLSAAYHILDQNEKAIEYCEKGLKIFRLKGIRQGEGRSCLNLSSYYLHRGDYATALKCNGEAFKTIRSLGYKAEEGDILLSQAKICNIFMQYGRSIECCKEALSIKTAMADQKNQLNISRKTFKYVRQPEIIAAKETATRTLILHISHWGRLKNQSSIVKGHFKS